MMIQSNPCLSVSVEPFHLFVSVQAFMFLVPLSVCVSVPFFFSFNINLTGTTNEMKNERWI